MRGGCALGQSRFARDAIVLTNNASMKEKMVARGRIELPTRGFSERDGDDPA